MVELRDRLWSLAACWTGREAQHHILVSSSITSSLASFVSYSAIVIFLNSFCLYMRNSVAARRCLGVLDWVVWGVSTQLLWLPLRIGIMGSEAIRYQHELIMVAAEA
jgi:hypothetical protein